MAYIKGLTRFGSSPLNRGEVRLSCKRGSRHTPRRTFPEKVAGSETREFFSLCCYVWHTLC